jgi:hypothetical protein
MAIAEQLYGSHAKDKSGNLCHVSSSNWSFTATEERGLMGTECRGEYCCSKKEDRAV